MGAKGWMCVCFFSVDQPNRQKKVTTTRQKIDVGISWESSERMDFLMSDWKMSFKSK